MRCGLMESFTNDLEKSQLINLNLKNDRASDEATECPNEQKVRGEIVFKLQECLQSLKDGSNYYLI